MNSRAQTAQDKSLPGVQPVANPPDGSHAPAIAIAAGDLLQISVFDTPELSAQVRVDQNGDINLPWGGKSHVEGMSPAQVADTLQAMLQQQKILKNPTPATVFVVEYATQGVKVLGQVKSPGIYPLLGFHRLFDLIASAGGVTDIASRTVTLIHPGGESHPVTVTLDYRSDRIAESDIEVLPGDTIVVSKAGVAYVLGDVGRPGGFLLQDNQQLTVLQALALAQGTNKTAKLNSAVIFRDSPEGRHEYKIELKKVLQGEYADLRLGDHDILYVPSSMGKTLGYRGIELGAQATAGVLIYHPW